MTLGRADQILSGDLFGLQSTTVLNEDLDKLKKRYHKLLAKESRNDEEEIAFRKLRDTLKSRIPTSGETPAERKALELICALLQPDGNGTDDDFTERTKGLAEELLNEVAKKRK